MVSSSRSVASLLRRRIALLSLHGGFMRREYIPSVYLLFICDWKRPLLELRQVVILPDFDKRLDEERCGLEET